MHVRLLTSPCPVSQVPKLHACPCGRRVEGSLPLLPGLCISPNHEVTDLYYRFLKKGKTLSTEQKPSFLHWIKLPPLSCSKILCVFWSISDPSFLYFCIFHFISWKYPKALNIDILFMVIYHHHMWSFTIISWFFSIRLFILLKKPFLLLKVHHVN